MSVDALVRRALHPEGGKLKRRRLSQDITDPAAIDIDPVRRLNPVADADHNVPVHAQLRVGDGLVIQLRQRVDDIRKRALLRDRLLAQELIDPDVLHHLRNQL